MPTKVVQVAFAHLTMDWDEDDLYCEQCGNSDWCIDCTETRAEV